MASAANNNNVKVNIINDQQTRKSYKLLKLNKINPWSSLTQSVVNESELVLSLDEECSLVPDV